MQRKIPLNLFEPLVLLHTLVMFLFTLNIIDNKTEILLRPNSNIFGTCLCLIMPCFLDDLDEAFTYFMLHFKLNTLNVSVKG